MPIRPATDSDLPALASIIREAYAEHRPILDPPASAFEETANSLRTRLENAALLLYERDGNPVGCVLYQVYPDHVYLFRLSVLPAYRRSGIGRMLVESVEDITRSKNLNRIQLGVRLQVPQNLRYYQKLGYQIIEYHTHLGYAKPTYVVMEKSLTVSID